MERKVFRSRISVLLMAVLLMPCVLSIRSGNIFNPVPLILSLVILLFCGMRYVVEDERIKIRIFWIIPCGSILISQINSVSRSYIPFSSPAASLKRLKILFNKNYKYPLALFSPVREQEFLDTLIIYNPKIKISVKNKKGWWRFWDWDI